MSSQLLSEGSCERCPYHTQASPLLPQQLDGVAILIIEDIDEGLREIGIVCWKVESWRRWLCICRCRIEGCVYRWALCLLYRHQTGDSLAVRRFALNSPVADWLIGSRHSPPSEVYFGGKPREPLTLNMITITFRIPMTVQFILLVIRSDAAPFSTGREKRPDRTRQAILTCLEGEE